MAELTGQVIVTNYGKQQILSSTFDVTKIKLGSGVWTPTEASTALNTQEASIAAAGAVVAIPAGGYRLHVNGLDDSTASYDVYEFALTDDTDQALAIYSQAAIIDTKGTGSTLVFAADFVIEQAGAGSITISGDTTFDLPQASTALKGIVEMATDAEVATGTDTTRAITPKHGADIESRTLLQALLSQVDDTAALGVTTRWQGFQGGIRLLSQAHIESDGHTGSDTAPFQVPFSGAVGGKTLSFKARAPGTNYFRVYLEETRAWLTKNAVWNNIWDFDDPSESAWAILFPSLGGSQAGASMRPVFRWASQGGPWNDTDWNAGVGLAMFDAYDFGAPAKPEILYRHKAPLAVGKIKTGTNAGVVWSPVHIGMGTPVDPSGTLCYLNFPSNFLKDSTDACIFYQTENSSYYAAGQFTNSSQASLYIRRTSGAQIGDYVNLSDTTVEVQFIVYGEPDFDLQTLP